jgi:hypothetical protein
VDSSVSVIVNNELGRICEEEIVSDLRYNMVFSGRNCSVKKNLGQDKWAVGQNVAPGHLMYGGLQLT